MLIHHPNISLKSSQTLYCDIANPKSYSGSGSNIIDLGRGKNNMTINGAITYSSSFGGILSFTGLTSQLISFNNTAASAPQSQGASWVFSMEFWFRISSLSAINGLFNQAAGLCINIQTTGAVRLMYSTSTQIGISNTNIISAGQWYHLVVTRDASNYFNVYINSLPIITNVLNSSSFSSTSTRIGYGGGSTSAFNGDIAIVKTYKGSVISQNNIIQNYNAIKGRFGL